MRLTQDIDVDRSKTGMTFKAIVDDPVMAGNAIELAPWSEASESDER